MRISDWSSYVCSSDLPVQVPGIGKKAEATVVNEEIWNFAGKTGVINVDPGAMPLKCSCTAALKSDGKGTVVTYTWAVKATVTLIGGQIEKDRTRAGKGKGGSGRVDLGGRGLIKKEK